MSVQQRCGPAPMGNSNDHLTKCCSENVLKEAKFTLNLIQFELIDWDVTVIFWTRVRNLISEWSKHTVNT